MLTKLNLTFNDRRVDKGSIVSLNGENWIITGKHFMKREVYISRDNCHRIVKIGQQGFKMESDR